MLLLSSFASLEELRDTPIDILTQMEGMNRNTAKRVIDYLKERKN